MIEVQNRVPGTREENAAVAELPLLQVSQLKRYFDVSAPFLNRLIERQPVQILKAVDDVSFQICKGETFSLVGESGCGKSTVAKLVVGLYAPTGGSIAYEGVNIAGLGRKQIAPLRSRIQMIFQDPYSSLNPRWRVKDIIGEPIKAFGLIEGKDAIARRVEELLEYVKLTPEDGEKYPHEFSGGQRQRISIARVLASQPQFLVCDEPTSALDVSVQAQILNLMLDLQREFKLTYLFISHDLAVVYHISDRVGIMYLGRLVEVAPVKTLFGRPRHPYTRMLLEAIPDIEMTGKKRTAVGGEVPNPINPPPGCAFHPRCPLSNERCLTEIPVLKPIEDDTLVACFAVVK